MTVDKKHSPRCFIDIEIDGENAGRIIMELFTDVCPITCENFRALCTGEKGLGKTTDKPLHYKGAPFHRVVKNFVIQGGDFVAGNGTGGESIYGGQFKDENFDIPHDKPFLLSMSNRGKDSNGSQFFITTQAAPHLNGKHTVFGQVIHGQEVVTKIENIKTDQSCRPIKDVKISNCGELVLKIHQKERKRHVSTESSDSESEEERLKRKRKHKHSKKHKKEKKEVKESNPSRKEEDSGCMVDPEEIPTIPTNNFLMRRTSPLGDRNRRPPQRESYSYGRPVVSRSGRKIKGRGFMRYRTPSRSTSRSGSETPPHWKQAQSRLRNIKDVVLPKKPIPPPPEEAESQHEEMEDAGGNVLHSRLGMVSRAAEDQKQKDARLIMRENRRNREWSSEESPPRNAPRGSGGSPLRSTVVVTSNFQKEPDRFRRSEWRSGNRRGRSPERRPFDRSNDNDSNRNRRQVAADSHKKTDRHHRSQQDIEKSMKDLTESFSRYRKDEESGESTDGGKDRRDKGKDRTDKDKDRENKTKADRPEEPAKPLSKRFKSLQSELIKYQKNSRISSESSEEEDEKGDAKDSEKAGANLKKEDFLKSTENELSEYRKDKSDYSSDDSSDEKIASQKVLRHVSQENTVASNGNDEEMPDRSSGFGLDHTKVKIPGICDSNEASMDTESQPQFVADMEFQTSSEQGVEGHEMPGRLIASNEGNTDKVVPAVKEKRRWDMQETETKKKVQDSIQIVFHTASLTVPEVIPLPEETKSDAMDVSEPHGMLSVTRPTKSKTPPMDYGRSRSRSPNDRVPDSPPMKSNKHNRSRRKRFREQDASANPNQKHSSTTRTSKDIRSPSNSPKATSYSKHIPRSPSNSPPPRRKSSSSPEPRTKKPRSPSPVSRRTRQSKSPASQSKSPAPRRGRQSKSPAPRHARQSKSPAPRHARQSKSPAPRHARQSKSPAPRHARQSKSPVPRHARQSKSPVPRHARQSKSPRRTRPSASRSRSRDRVRRRRSRSPLNVRSRRSVSRDRGSRFRRYGNRSPDRRGGFRYGKSPSFRGRLGGRARRTRSRSPIRRRRARRSSSSSGSSSSRSSSSRSDRRKKVAKGKRRSSSSSSSSRSKKSDSDSASP